jgi:arabinogalactan oligomer / maltooligosaccharide transport system substrate-binding protein
MNPETRVRALAAEYVGGRIDRRELLRAAAALGLGEPAIASLVAAARPAGVAARSGGFANTPKGPKVAQLDLWTRSTPDAPDNTEFAHIKAVADAYTAAIGTPIELVTVPDQDFKQKLGIVAPNGEGPDVYGPIVHDWVGEFAVRGIAAEVPDRLIDGKEDIYASAFQAVTADGKRYGIPVFVESVALIYNTDLVSTPPATWAELVTAAKELTRGDVYGFGFPLLEPYHEGGFFYGFGGYVFRFDGGHFNTDDIGLDSEGGVEAATFLRDMYNTQQPPMPPAAIDRQNMHKVQESMMESKRLAMTIDGPWRESRLRTTQISYSVAKLPTLPNGRPMRPFLGIQLWAANAYSKNKDAALDFISFASGTDSVVELYQGFLKAPVRLSATESNVVKANPMIPTWSAQAADGVPMPNVSAMSKVWGPWGEAMDAIIPKNASDDRVKTLLDDATARIEKAIEEANQ